MDSKELPDGLTLERVLATRPGSQLAVVRRGRERLVLRLGEPERAIHAELLPLARVEHPALVAPVEWGTTASGRPFVLRPYAEGETLDVALARADDPAAALTGWSAALLEGLAALHEAGLVHRDVKADNVIVGPDGPRLIDFELAVLCDAAGVPAGTRGHLAPEVLAGHPPAPAADLFALGVMLARACLGAPDDAFAARFPGRDFFAAAELDADALPRGLAPLVRALVHRHPGDRPPSARGALSLLPGAADTPPPDLRLPRFAGRSALLAGAARDVAATRRLLVLAVSDPSELDAVAREVRLAVTLEGDGQTPVDDAGRDAPGENPRVAVGRSATRAVEELRHALALPGTSLALLAPADVAEQATAALRDELAPSEAALLEVRELPPLTPAALGEHLERLSGGVSPEVARRLGESLFECTDGGLTEIQRRLARGVEDGVLRPIEGGYALLVERWPAAVPEPGEGPDGPPDAGRLDREAQAVLGALAVLGEDEDPARLASVAALDDDAVARGVRALRAAGALEVRRDARAALRPTWRDAVRAWLDASARAALHARAAEVLAPADRVRSTLHLLRAGAQKRRLEAALALAESERTAGRAGVARELLCAVLEHAPRRSAELRDRAAAVLARVELGQVDARAALDAARAVRGTDLADAPCDLLQVAGEAAETAGERTVARELYERALALAPGPAEAHRATLGLAYSAWLDGDVARALELTAGLPTEETPAETAGALRNLRGGALASLGELEESRALLDQAADDARRSGDPTLHGRTELNRAFAARRAGDLGAAREALAVAVTAFEGAGHVRLRSLALNNAGVLERDLGHLAAAEGLLVAALAIRRRTGDTHGTAVSMSNLGALALDAGRIPEALTWLRDARGLLQRGGYTGELAIVAANEATALAFADRCDEARAALHEATPLVETRPVLLSVSVAAVTWAAGDEAAAAEVLERSLAASEGAEELADRFRAARLWCALRPGSPGALEALRRSAIPLDSPQRRAEVAWSGRAPGVAPGVTTLRELAACFDGGGHTALARAVALELGGALHRASEQDERREVMARAAAATEALVASLDDERGRRSLARIDRAAGHLPTAPHAARVEVDWLLEWNRRLAGGEDLERLLRSTVEKALAVTGAERGFLVLLDGDDVELLVARGMGRDELPTEELRFSRTVVREATRRHEAIASADLLHDPRTSGATSVVSIGARAVLCVPLPELPDLGGALYVDREGTSAPFDTYDEDALRTLADQAAIGVASLTRQRELTALNARLREQLAHREHEVGHLRHALRSRPATPPLSGLAGESDALRDLEERVVRLAGSELPVLVTGPRGGPVAAVARALHERGPRAKGPFHAANLRALAHEEQAEALFGRAAAATTSGARRRLGLLARAHRGTLFVDGIEGLAPELHARLLDALDTGRHHAEDSTRVQRGDVRLVAASSSDLRDLAGDGRFDEELLHLLEAAPVRVPSLAERVDDVPAIAERMLEELNARYDTTKSITPEVLAALARRPWPGELRELRNEVSRLYFFADGQLERPEQVRTPQGSRGAADLMPASFRIADLERAAIARALEAAGQNKGRAAELLGISRAGLYKKLDRLGLSAVPPARARARRQRKSGRNE